MKATFLLVVLLLLLSATVISSTSVSPEPRTFSPPPSIQPQDVPTLAQVRAAAWTLQASINAAAGRKTSAALDGTGGILTPPTEITTDTAWVNKHVTFTRRMYLNVTGGGPPTTKVLNFWVNNSLLDGSALTTLLYPTFIYTGSCCYSNYPWTINLRVINSTVQNFGNFTFPVFTTGGYNTGTHFNLYYDNATFKNVGGTATQVAYNVGTNCDIEIHFCDSFIHDSTFDTFGTYGIATALLQENDAGHPTVGYVMRSRFIGNAASDVISAFPVAKWNYMTSAGFNPIDILQRDFTPAYDGVPATGGEKVNYSYNYFDGATHTSIGIGGSSWDPSDYWQKPMFGPTQYASVYKNYVNNSGYIQYQTYGNASNLRYVNNYHAHGGVSGTGYFSNPSGFSEAWLLGVRTHNVSLDSNYIFDEIDTHYYANGVCCHGIVLSSFNYNITVKNNVLYNLGGYAFWIGSEGLKFKDSGGTERSDYTYRASQMTFLNNYVNGMNYDGINQDSGYTSWSNNTLTNPLGGPYLGAKAFVHTSDGWNPNGLGTQIDWFGGTNLTGHVTIDPSGTVSRRPLVWVRSFQYGTLNIQADGGSYPIHFQDRGPTGFWGRTFQCTTDQTPQIATRWTNLPCNPMEDAQNFTVGGDSSAWRPLAYWDYTHTPTYIPVRLKIDYTIPAGSTLQVIDLTTGQQVPYTISSININILSGDNYQVRQVGAGGGGGGGNPPPVINGTTISGFAAQVKLASLGIAAVGMLLLWLFRPSGRVRSVLIIITVGAALVFVALVLQGY